MMLTPGPRWEDVELGQPIEGPSTRLGWTDIALQVSGSQDWNHVHHDPDFARDSGHESVFFNTGWTSAMLARVVTDWIGPVGWLQRLEFRMRQMNVPGDVVTARAEPTGKRLDDFGRRLVELKVWLENDRVGVTTVGTAVVRLDIS
jgi:acyl dehydratase